MNKLQKHLMINRKRTLIVQLNYFDTLLDKWNSKKPLSQHEARHLKEVLKSSDICKKCGELHNQVRETKIQYIQPKTHNIQHMMKWLIVISSFSIFYNVIFGVLFVLLMLLSFFYIKNMGLITKCLNCGSNDSFVKIKKYMKK